MAEMSGAARPPAGQWVSGPHVFAGVALELSGTLGILVGSSGIALDLAALWTLARFSAT